MPQSSRSSSAWPFKASLLCWFLLMGLGCILLVVQYSTQQSNTKRSYRINQQSHQQKLNNYVDRFQQDQRRRLESFYTLIETHEAATTVPAASIEQWWQKQSHALQETIQWIDQQGQSRWHKGVDHSRSQNQWFEDNSDSQYRAAILCQDSRCEELSILPIVINDVYRGAIRARRPINRLLHDLALDANIELAILDASLQPDSGWQAHFYTLHTGKPIFEARVSDGEQPTLELTRQLTQQQLIPLGDPALLKSLSHQPKSLADLTGDESVWSLLSFPEHYARDLHLISREDPSILATASTAHLKLYALFWLLVSTFIAAGVWWFAKRLSHGINFYSQLLPLLGDGHYQQLRERLEPLKTESALEEFSSLNEAFNTLSYQLESLDNAVDIRNQEMERLSLFDSLSGLPNRHLFQYEIQNDLRELRQHNREGIVAVLLLDLDKFKRINDSLGHHLGDQVLEKMGSRLKGSIRSLGIVARLGGDEFAILLRSVKRVEQLDGVCKKILELVNKPLEVDHKNLVISCSIGVSVASVGDTYNDALKHAEIAMYKAKDSGGNNYRLFNAQMASEADLNLSLEGEIRRGFSEQEYTLYLQPKVNMNGVIKGFESLVRWDHPERGILPPGEFIPAMENMGFISQLDNWVLEASCRQLKVLEPLYPNLSIAVNISSTHFTDHTFLEFLQNCLRKYPIDPSKLELEITETLLMENMSTGREVIARIKQLGVRIAIDDFGTGYSSLSYLKILPVDTLKIDREFIKDIPDSESDMQISSVIIFLAKQLNFCVVAEGVETSEQLVFLKASQCDLAQGFYFSKPIPAHKAILMLESERIDLSAQNLE
ncbi:MAG: putative bifunctional diguanylate cyclase/phosphodiesterase [Cellvibrionaceae bacterium]